MRRNSVTDAKTLIRLIEEEIDPIEAREVEKMLRENPEVARRASELQQIIRCLGQVKEPKGGIDVVPQVMTAVAMDTRQQAHGRWPRYLSVGLAASIAAALVLFFTIGRSTQEKPNDSIRFRVKGEALAENEREKWTDIDVYVTNGSASPTVLGPRLRSGDALLFSYTNNGPEPFEYLMVFAVDSRGAVYWYYPAYITAETDPISITIADGARDLPLQELIRHPISPGPIAIFSLFTDTPMRVSHIERMVDDYLGDMSTLIDEGTRLPIADSAQQVLRTEVVQ